MSGRLSWVVIVAIALSIAAPGRVLADTITKWDFDVTGAQSAPYNSPPPAIGSGTAIMLGMNNTYNGGNTASADVLATQGVANNTFVENTWRVRGVQAPAGHNGWATAAAGAAQYTQGIELDASTAGFTNIKFSFDWFSTNQAPRDLQFQYNTNVSNSAGWTNFGGTSPTGTFIAVAGDYYNAPGAPAITLDMSAIAAANDDANFGIRLVSAFDSTGHVPNDYAGALLTGGLTTIYNNSSGNWRFDKLTFSGDPVGVPEPSSMLLAASAATTLAVIRRRRLGKCERTEKIG
jgi:hypothetical protein